MILAGKDDMPEIRIVEEPCTPVFLEEARAVKADLVVMGTLGHSAIGEIVLGSVARKMIHKTTVPVMLMPYFGGQ